VNKVNLFEGIWRGVFISIGLFMLFSILFTTKEYFLIQKIMLTMTFSMVYLGFFFNKNITLYIFVSILGILSILYIYFFQGIHPPFKFYNIILPLILIGLIHLLYLKIENKGQT